MTLWNHSDDAPLLDKHFTDGGKCPFCESPLSEHGTVPGREGFRDDALFVVDFGVEVLVCHACGWWKLTQGVQDSFPKDDPFTPDRYSHRTYAAVACLEDLDLADVSLPLAEVRAFLLARAEARFSLHPALFEETVASVFRDLGYGAVVTSYSGDGGIDIILEAPGTSTIGVQVKRWRNSVKVEQIRSLLGALVLGGHTRGVFVTTSDYQSGASVVAKQADGVGVPITLVNGSDFLEALRIAQLRSPLDYDFSRAPFTTATLQVLSYNEGPCGDPQIYVWERPYRP